MDQIYGMNQARVTGTIVSDFTFSHRNYKEGFYYVEVLVKRLSKNADRIPVMVSDQMIDVARNHIGELIEVQGQFRSFNQMINKRSRLLLSLHAKKIHFAATGKEERLLNEITLDGYLCRQPVYRITPMGREITDFMVAVNRSAGKTDYIPCICWGKTARFAARMMVGGRISLQGRIQSRDYLKKTGDSEMVKKTTYEVSVSRLQYVVPATPSVKKE